MVLKMKMNLQMKSMIETDEDITVHQQRYHE